MDYQLRTPTIPLSVELTAVERVLSNRGIKPQDIKHYLNTTNDDILNPNLIANMDAGVKMLISHIANNERIMIQVDSDCDGFTSAATLINYLNCLFPSFAQNNIYYRLHTGKEHGILLNTIPEDVKLVIAPDSSSNDYDEHAALAAQGVDVLVIDHHEAEKVSEYACVINNQLCDYPTKSLSGVGMVYKFCAYIDSLMNVDYAEQFLDLVALGMVADMMPLTDFETKHLISLGLANLRNPFFYAMVRKNEYSLRDGVTPMGVAFYIAPYVNATIRMGTHEEKMILFESMLDFKGYEQIPSTKRGCRGQMETRVEQACRNCANIKSRQTKARDSMLEQIENIIAENNLLDNKILAVKLKDMDVDKNLTGLIANQLMAKYQRPVLLLNKVITTNIYLDELNQPMTIDTISWEGSGRGYDKSRFDDFREFMRQSGLAMYAEGHANAFGAGILDSKFSTFVQYSNQALESFDFSPCYTVDFIFDGGNFKGGDIVELAELKGLWGQGLEEPFIAVENVKVTSANITLMSADKNPTLKISLPNGTSLIKFKSSIEEYEKLKSTNGLITLNIVGKCERNLWNGTVTPQIIIEDYEITDVIDYYF